MYRFFETIAVQDGKILNSEWHQKRYLETLRAFYGRKYSAIQIDQIKVPPIIGDGLVRCRMGYNAKRQKIYFVRYQKREIKTFQPMIDNHIQYEYKMANRKKLEKLFFKRGHCDEIMIVKNGFITDCLIGNLIFLRQGEWFTPTTYLLNGTQRQLLLSEKRIAAREIKLQDVDKYEEIRVINALNRLENE